MAELDIETQKADVAASVGVIDEEVETLDSALSRFRLLPENAVPIPPTIGTRFGEMFDEGIQMLQTRHVEWKANIATFMAENEVVSDVPTENLVRTTVESLVDYTYMRNPQAEISSQREIDKPLEDVLQKALTALMNKKTLPGINLRPKVLKQIIFGHLTNFGVLELTYQGEKGSLEEVLKVNEKVKEAIKSEEDGEKAEKLYSLLDILQKDLDVRKNVGIGVRARSPFAFIVDPNCQELDLSDCSWYMDRDVMKINYIQAEYMLYDEESEKYRFRYDENVEFSFASITEHTKASTETSIMESIMPDVDEEQAKLRTKNTMPIVWIYDRTTRLKYLYIEGKWDTPLWVYPDEMNLSRFFPFFLLAFSAPLNSVVQSGEVSHYMGFQRAINMINRQVDRIRRNGFSKWLYDASVVDKKEADKLFAFMDDPNMEQQALGLKIKDGDKALSDAFEPLKLPTAQFKEVFDKTDLREGLDRTTRITDAMRGAQYRVNTTNDAIGTYNEFANNRLEGLTDKIELSVEGLMWGICELIVSKMGTEQISTLLSIEDAKIFKSMSVEEFNQNHNLTVAAGSTEKPTSQSKKKEATQIIQMLGQFGTAAPMTVLSLVTKLLKSAFSKNLVSPEDLNKLEEEGRAAMQKGVSTQPPPQQ